MKIEKHCIVDVLSLETDDCGEKLSLPDDPKICTITGPSCHDRSFSIPIVLHLEDKPYTIDELRYEAKKTAEKDSRFKIFRSMGLLIDQFKLVL